MPIRVCMMQSKNFLDPGEFFDIWGEGDEAIQWGVEVILICLVMVVVYEWFYLLICEFGCPFFCRSLY
jgi:hypothetical protein